MHPQKEKALTTLKKAAGLLRKIVAMTEDNAYCIDVMQQNLAAVGLLKSAHQSLMEAHLDTCVESALASGSAAKKRKMVEEILRVSSIANR